MFNPTILDEVCVQATHLEARGKNVREEGKNNHLRVVKNERVSKENKRKIHPLKKKGIKPHVNIVAKRVMMKSTIGSFIQN